jgi:hypothetical protein
MSDLSRVDPNDLDAILMAPQQLSPGIRARADQATIL